MKADLLFLILAERLRSLRNLLMGLHFRAIACKLIFVIVLIRKLIDIMNSFYNLNVEIVVSDIKWE